MCGGNGRRDRAPGDVPSVSLSAWDVAELPPDPFLSEKPSTGGSTPGIAGRLARPDAALSSSIEGLGSAIPALDLPLTDYRPAIWSLAPSGPPLRATDSVAADRGYRQTADRR